MLVAGPTTVLATAPGLTNVSITVGRLVDGGYTVVWCSPCASANTLFAQRFDDRGASAGPQVRLSLDNSLADYFVGAGVMPDGSLMLAHGVEQLDFAANLVHDSLFIRRYDSSGMQLGASVEVASYLRSLIGNPISIRFTSASFLSWENGSLAVSWGVSSIDGRSPMTVKEAFARIYDASGNPLGEPRRLAREALGSGSQLLGLARLCRYGVVLPWASVPLLTQPASPARRSSSTPDSHRCPRKAWRRLWKTLWSSSDGRAGARFAAVADLLGSRLTQEKKELLSWDRGDKRRSLSTASAFQALNDSTNATSQAPDQP